MARKPTAYPELIEPGEWTVDTWQPNGDGIPPCTSRGLRRMLVPAGDGPFAKEIRFHELLHVKYSPPEVPDVEGVTAMSILASEDCRVNLLGALIRPHDALKHGPAPDPFMLAAKITQRDMARLTVASLGYTSVDYWINNLDEELGKLARIRALPGWLRTHIAALRATMRMAQYDACSVLVSGPRRTIANATFDDTIRLARWIDETFSDKAPGPEPGKGSENDEEGDYADEPGSGGDASAARWGTMEIKAPPLTIAHPNALGRRTTPCTEGNRLAHWNRLVTGEVFGRTRKRSTPDAVLIDNSGSMHWDASKLHELVKHIPVGIVAAYDGGGGEGELKILAKDGRMVAASEVEARWGGNEVDGPALRWLAKQQGRKVWVSDQGVCSDVCGDEEALMADCNAVVKAAGIRVCLTTDPAAIMRALRTR